MPSKSVLSQLKEVTIVVADTGWSATGATAVRAKTEERGVEGGNDAS